MVARELLDQSVGNSVGKIFFHEFHSYQPLNILIGAGYIQELISSIRTVFNYYECVMVLIKTCFFTFLNIQKQLILVEFSEKLEGCTYDDIL